MLCLVCYNCYRVTTMWYWLKRVIIAEHKDGRKIIWLQQIEGVILKSANIAITADSPVTTAICIVRRCPWSAAMYDSGAKWLQAGGVPFSHNTFCYSRPETDRQWQFRAYYWNTVQSLLADCTVDWFSACSVCAFHLAVHAHRTLVAETRYQLFALFALSALFSMTGLKVLKLTVF